MNPVPKINTGGERRMQNPFTGQEESGKTGENKAGIIPFQAGITQECQECYSPRGARPMGITVGLGHICQEPKEQGADRPHYARLEPKEQGAVRPRYAHLEQGGVYQEVYT